VRMPERVTEKWGANPHHRKRGGSAARVIRGGLVGPKGEASADPDGQQVDSPVPPKHRLTRVGSWGAGSAARRAPSKLVGRDGFIPVSLTERQVRAAPAMVTARDLRLNSRERPARGGVRVPVPQTDTGRLAEQAKVDE
jgi:hypothetical protein